MIRIVSEGGVGRGTKFIDTETGENIGKVLDVEFGATLTVGEVVTAQCRLAMVEVDVTAAKTDFLTMHPISKDYQPVAAIVFRDGWRIDFMEDGTPRARQQTPDR
jgi:hypothetical protein